MSYQETADQSAAYALRIMELEELLKKYMALVSHEEGTFFVTHLEPGQSYHSQLAPFTATEVSELRRIAETLR